MWRVPNEIEINVLQKEYFKGLRINSFKTPSWEKEKSRDDVVDSNLAPWHISWPWLLLYVFLVFFVSQSKVTSGVNNFSVS